jgi:hypothetical protein
MARNKDCELKSYRSDPDPPHSPELSSRASEAKAPYQHPLKQCHSERQPHRREEPAFAFAQMPTPAGPRAVFTVGLQPDSRSDEARKCWVSEPTRPKSPRGRHKENHLRVEAPAFRPVKILA